MSESLDQLTVVEMVYHHVFGEETQVVESRYSRRLQGCGEQMYGPRNLTATEEWQSLDLGWVPEPGLLHIQNREGQNFQVNPTPEERADIAKRILEVSYSPLSQGVDGWLILPGESMRGYPTNPGKLFIRSRHGRSRYTLALIPR